MRLKRLPCFSGVSVTVPPWPFAIERASVSPIPEPSIRPFSAFEPRNVAELEAPLPRLDLREREEPLDEARQAVRLARHDPETLLGLGLALDAAELERLDEHADRRERGAELVGHVRHEVALEL